MTANPGLSAAARRGRGLGVGLTSRARAPAHPTSETRGREKPTPRAIPSTETGYLEGRVVAQACWTRTAGDASCG